MQRWIGRRVRTHTTYATSRKILRCRSMVRQHANNCHHAAVFVVKNMAMIDKISRYGPAEIHPHLDPRVATAAGPVWHLIGVAPLPFFCGDVLAVYLQHQEMNLVNVEL